MGTITELVGPAAAGKTQMCLALTAEVVVTGRGEGIGVVYLDLDGHFQARRLCRLIETALKRHGASESAESLMFRVNVLQAQGWEEFVGCLQRLPALLREFPAQLVILDSIANPALQFEHGVVARQQELIGHAALLKSLAVEHNLAVVITNRTFGRHRDNWSEVEENDAMLGNSWAHCVNVRLAIKVAQSADARRPLTTYPSQVGVMKVKKAHYCSESSFEFVIGEEGFASCGGLDYTIVDGEFI